MLIGNRIFRNWRWRSRLDDESDRSVACFHSPATSALTQFELSFDTPGTALSTNGFVAVLIQTILFPMLHGRYGTIRLLRCVKLAFPACFISLPIIGIFTHLACPDGKTGNEQSSFIAMTGIVLALALKCFGNMSIGTPLPSPSFYPLILLI